MKKLLATLIIVTMLAGIACVAVGCYNSKPAVMKELVGTYELTQFTRWHTENQGEESTTQETDLKAERGIQAYLVVKNNGRGYYIYKDNGGLTAREVAITYTYDDKNTNQIKEITYTDGLASSGDGYPGKGRETLGLTFGLKEKTLNFYYAQINGKLIKRDYSQKVVYKKVSKSADLSYVESKLQVRLNIPRMEIGGLDGWQVYDSYNESNPLVYFYIDMHVAEGQATIYYMFRSDGIRHQENCALTFDVPEDNSQPIAIHVGDDVFYAYNYVTTIPSTIWHQDEMGIQDMWFSRYSRDDFDVESKFTSALTEAASNIKYMLDTKAAEGVLSSRTKASDIKGWLAEVRYIVVNDCSPQMNRPSGDNVYPHVQVGANNSDTLTSSFDIFVMDSQYYIIISVDHDGNVQIGQKQLF